MVVADQAQDEGAGPAMTAVQHAPDVFIVGEESVGFIDQQRRPRRLDGAKYRGGGRVRRR
jgi:hypothetical protein